MQCAVECWNPPSFANPGSPLSAWRWRGSPGHCPVHVCPSELDPTPVLLSPHTHHTPLSTHTHHTPQTAHTAHGFTTRPTWFLFGVTNPPIVGWNLCGSYLAYPPHPPQSARPSEIRLVSLAVSCGVCSEPINHDRRDTALDKTQNLSEAIGLAGDQSPPIPGQRGTPRVVHTPETTNEFAPPGGFNGNSGYPTLGINTA
mgnify:CR=1 FL=1